MAFLHSFTLVVTLLTFLKLCPALELLEIRPGGALSGKPKIRPRDSSSLDLRSAESFLWGGDDSSSNPWANFTIYAPEDNENVISMEKFGGLLLSCSITATGLSVQFVDDQSFADAQRVWEWVNGADERTFLMIAGAGDCDDNSRRTPYLVSEITYDTTQKIADLTAITGPWQDLTRSYELRVGNLAAPLGGKVGKRDITQGVVLPLANDIPFVATIEQGSIVGEVECEACRTTGQVDFELIVSQDVVGLPDGVELSLSPRGVSALANLKLTVSSEIVSEQEVFQQTVLSIPLTPIAIPGILDIGPTFDIDVGVELSGVEGSITVSESANSTLSDSAILRANLLNPADNEFSGWEPVIDFGTPTVEAQVSATLQIFVLPALRLKAEVLGQGAEAGLELKLPFIDLTLEAIANSEGGICDVAENTIGVNIAASIGVELTFAAGITDVEELQTEIVLATAEFPLGELCFGTDLIGGDNATVTSTSSMMPPPPTATSSETSAATATELARCTASNGLFGTCVSTHACSMQGRVSEAGHCSGGTDVQCCFQPPDFNSDSCKTDEGVSGTCTSTHTCAAANGQSVPGFCAGLAHIQCCIPTQEPPQMMHES